VFTNRLTSKTYGNNSSKITTSNILLFKKENFEKVCLYQLNHQLKQHDFDQCEICSNHHVREYILQQYNNLQDQLEMDVQVQDDI